MRHPAIVVFLKDLRSELRTRYALNALMMFILTTLATIVFSIGNENVSPEVLSGVLWVIIFFSSMSGLSRTFVSEEERGTVLTLRTLAKPIHIYIGKLFFNVVLLFLINIFAVALYCIFITAFAVRSYAVFTLTIVLGTFGLASAATIIAAIISKANNKGTLFPVLAFPILLPLILTVINATQLAVGGATLLESLNEFQVLISYTVAIVTVSYLLFDFIWRD